MIEIRPRADYQRACLSPGGFAEVASGGRWVRAPHLDVADQVLRRLLTEDSLRIALFMPPRHGKSELVSRYTPAWYLGMRPTHRVIETSYEANFAESWTAKARDLLVDHGDLFGVEVLRGSSAPKSGWEIQGHAPDEKGLCGVCYAAGAGGPITGKGANLAIIDDPIKNAEQAYSAVHRQKIWDWYSSTLYTRLEPKGSVILILTRWHEDDLAGRLLAKMAEGGDRWEVIRFPALAEEADVLGRKVGEALWPDRYSAQTLAEMRVNMGPYWFSSLMQQRPTVPEGAVFRSSCFRYWWPEGLNVVIEKGDGLQYRFALTDCIRILTVDTALKKGEMNDWTVFQTSLITPGGHLLVEHVERQRLEIPDQWPALQREYRRRRPVLVAIEEKASGIGLLQKAYREGVPAQPLKADTDKNLRAEPAAVAYGTESIYHRIDASWLDAFEQELLGFPLGAHDDQVDTHSYAWQIVIGKQCRIPGGGVKPKDRADPIAPLRESRGEAKPDRDDDDNQKPPAKGRFSMRG